MNRDRDRERAGEDTPLSRYKVFHTNSIAKIAPATKRFSAEHERRILDDGPLSYQLNTALLDNFQVGWIQCNRDMEINVPQRFPFYLLHFLEAGLSRYSGPDLAAVNTPGHAVILSPMPNLKIRHIAATAYSLSLPESLMQGALSEILGNTPDEKLCFDPQIDLKSPVGRAIKGQLDFLVKDLDHPDSHMMNSPIFQARFAENMACLLINGLNHNFTSKMKHNIPTTGLGRVHKIEAYIRNHLSEPLTLGILAGIVCVSERALQKDFRQHRKTSPMVHLREKRFEAIYKGLLNPLANTTVSNVASKFGITNLSRFSGRYKEYYGETPSQTLARGKKGDLAL